MYPQCKPSMSLGEALTSVFKQYAVFTGRARRSEFWWFQGFLVVLSFVFNFAIMGMMLLMIADSSNSINDASFNFIYGVPLLLYYIIYSIVGIALFLPSLAVTIRRLHDIGKSGWNYLWGIIPLIGGIFLLVWTCQDSEVEENKYGKSPKYIQE